MSPWYVIMYLLRRYIDLFHAILAVDYLPSNDSLALSAGTSAHAIFCISIVRQKGGAVPSILNNGSLLIPKKKQISEIRNCNNIIT